MTNSGQLQPYHLETYSDSEDAVDSSSSEQSKSKSVDPKKVLKLYHYRLTNFEKTEIQQYNQVRLEFRPWIEVVKRPRWSSD